MRYQISGKQIDVGDALQSHVKTELGETIEKYSQRPTDAMVTFARNAHEFICEITVHLSTGLTVAARGQAVEVYAAFESCREKMDKQLRRYKRRLKDHHRERSEPVEFADAPMYVLAANGNAGESEPDSLQPMIIAEMETKIPSLSVGEAVMQMELTGAALLVFHNEKSGAVNVVHRRDDGNVGWIDSSASR
ncbi:MAG: ribosome-associated translation inhibitor RaiA [Paracoccaceae bacterium]